MTANGKQIELNRYYKIVKIADYGKRTNQKRM
jgi:hypothetical protein